MDIKTVILSLAIGNIVFGFALFLYQIHEQHSPKNIFWIAAKILQAGGWLLLHQRGEIPVLLSFTLGNTLLLSGFAYECWAMFRISGRTVDRLSHNGAIIAIVVASLIATPWSPANKIAMASFVSVVFFGLSGWAMLQSDRKKSPLRIYLGWSMWLVVVIVFLRGFWALYAPEGFALFSGNAIQRISFICMYYLLLTNGFGMLLLSKEATDRDVNALLKEQQDALSRTKRLEGIISICMYCKKIDNKDESWELLEKYISQHSDARFSHGICPECYSREVKKIQ